jgi:hypothetical protein
MTVIVRHRINSLEDLSIIEKSFGIEVDVRSKNGELVMAHDPFSDSHTLFHDWLESYDHNLLIVNLKEEGLELKIITQLNASGVSNYFFLDQSFPFLIKLIHKVHYKTSIRYSDIESIHTIENLLKNNDGKPNWVWIDSFSGNWEHLRNLSQLKQFGFKLCLASPELHGRSLDSEIDQITGFCNVNELDAVCTKLQKNWERTLI